LTPVNTICCEALEHLCDRVEPGFTTETRRHGEDRARRLANGNRSRSGTGCHSFAGSFGRKMSGIRPSSPSQDRRETTADSAVYSRHCPPLSSLRVIPSPCLRVSVVSLRRTTNPWGYLSQSATQIFLSCPPSRPARPRALPNPFHTTRMELRREGRRPRRPSRQGCEGPGPPPARSLRADCGRSSRIAFRATVRYRA